MQLDDSFADLCTTTYLIVRFANLINQSGMKNEMLWQIIKLYKENYIMDHTAELSSKRCFIGTTSVLEFREDINIILLEIEKKLGIKASKEIQKNITKETLKDAAEMFLYLNLCTKSTMFQWIQFYSNLLKNASPDMIVIALNRILVAAKLSGEEASVGTKVFKYVAMKLSLQYHIVDQLTSMTNIDLKPTLEMDMNNFNASLGKFQINFVWILAL